MIGFCGYARVGKNTAAEELVKIIPDKQFEMLGFADTLKSDLKPCIDWAKSMGIDTTSATFKETIRPMYVLWSRVAKEIVNSKMIWVERLHQAVQICEKYGAIPLITDVRYDYEIAYILDNGGHVIFIERPEYRPANDEESHSFFDIDRRYHELKKTFTVVNDGTKEELGEIVLKLLQKNNYF